MVEWSYLKKHEIKTRIKKHIMLNDFEFCLFDDTYCFNLSVGEVFKEIVYVACLNTFGFVKN